MTVELAAIISTLVFDVLLLVAGALAVRHYLDARQADAQRTADQLEQHRAVADLQRKMEHDGALAQARLVAEGLKSSVEETRRQGDKLDALARKLDTATTEERTDMRALFAMIQRLARQTNANSLAIVGLLAGLVVVWRRIAQAVVS